MIAFLLRVLLPRPVADELDEERVAARSRDALLEGVVFDRPPPVEDGPLDRKRHIVVRDPGKFVALRAQHEREHAFAEQVADDRGEAGAEECELQLLAECVLDDRAQLHELVEQVSVQLVHADQQPRLLRGEDVAQVGDLGAQARQGNVSLRRVPAEASAEAAGHGCAHDLIVAPSLSIFSIFSISFHLATSDRGSRASESGTSHSY